LNEYADTPRERVDLDAIVGTVPQPLTGIAAGRLRSSVAGPTSTAMLQRKPQCLPSGEKMTLPILSAPLASASMTAIGRDREQIGFHVDALMFRDDCCRAASEQ